MKLLRGYAIIHRPDKYALAHLFDDLRNPTPEQAAYIAKFSSTFSFLESRSYRGTSRIIIEGWDPSQNNPTDPVWELDARFELRRIVPNLEGHTWDEPWLLQNLDAAKAVFAKLRKPSNYEVVYLSKEPEFAASNSSTLGYDIGYWNGSDPFSLIGDCIALTRWHTPPPDALEEVGRRLQCLNQNVLFSTSEEANDFREYYLTQPWAEVQGYPGEFAIIQLTRVDLQ